MQTLAIGILIAFALIGALFFGFNLGVDCAKDENELLKADNEKKDMQIDVLIRKDGRNANG